MKPKEYPYELQELVIQRAREMSYEYKNASRENILDTKLSILFNWNDSPEKGSFWMEVQAGNFKEVRSWKEYPKPSIDFLYDIY